MTLSVEWLDSGREPQVAPNPDYPKGKDMDMTTDPAAPSCETRLPWPARRCGVYLVTCDSCGLRVGVTTAGRPDDPRSLKVNCLKRKETH